MPISKSITSMVGITLPLPANLLHGEEQVLDFEKIATFIGGNGSGKSTILKSIFDEKLKGDMYEDYKVVCFSSGQNESYSNNFSDYLNKERASRNALNLDCFYYDKLWSILLIFLATTGKYDGLVRGFLKVNGYIDENEYDQDISTKLSVKVKVDQGYVNLVKQARMDEAEGQVDVITNKPYHLTLNSFIDSLLSDEGYDFETALERKHIELDQEILSRVSFEKSDEAAFDSKVMFFTQAADNDYFLIKNSFDLSFSKNERTIHLQDLSDGEYQLLFLYALIDLFDSNNTLFLFDEADSHLHYRNIEKLWSVYDCIQGSILTTTHLLDSISKSGLNRLRVIDKGKIAEGKKLKYVADRLKDLAEITNAKFEAMSLVENIVFIDDENDWEIFQLLAIKKLSDELSEPEVRGKLNRFLVIKTPSGYDSHSQDFGSAKLGHLERFAKFLEGHSHTTKNAFLICDRDELSLGSIGTDACKLVVRGSGIQKFNDDRLTSHLLSWKRREIKHYLLSPTALTSEDSELGALNNQLNLGPRSLLVRGNSSDYDTDGNYNEDVAMIRSALLKDIINPHVNSEYGFCKEKAKIFVDAIPKEEVSEDIKTMFDYLVDNNE